MARLRSRSCIINSEAVACDDNGVALFNRVRYRHHDETIFFYAFALIELNGDDLRADPLEGRKATPEMILAKAGAGIRFSEHMEGDGEAVPRPCFGQPRQGPPARPAIPNHERGNHKSVSLASKALAPTGRTRPTSQAGQ
jgi:bifunctional non-homologous end joining protein LigD